MNDHLDDRVTDALRAEATIRPDAAAAFDRFEGGRRLRRRRTQAVTAAAVVVLVVGAGVAVAMRGTQHNSNVTAAGHAPSTTSDEPVAGAQGAGTDVTSTTSTTAGPTASAIGGSGTVSGTAVTVNPPAPSPTTSSAVPPAPSTTKPATGGHQTVTVTQSDNGKSYTLHKGDRLIVQLQSSGYEWTEPASSDDSVLHRTGGTSGTSASATFSATAQGTADVTSTGDLPCRKATPPCMAPSQLFRVTVNVAG